MQHRDYLRTRLLGPPTMTTILSSVSLSHQMHILLCRAMVLIRVFASQISVEKSSLARNLKCVILAVDGSDESMNTLSLSLDTSSSDPCTQLHNLRRLRHFATSCRCRPKPDPPSESKQLHSRPYRMGRTALEPRTGFRSPITVRFSGGTRFCSNYSRVRFIHGKVI